MVVPPVTQSQPAVTVATGIARAPDTLDRDRCAHIHPVEEVTGGIAPGKWHPDASVRSGPIRNGGVSVDEYVSVNLDAPGHWGKIVELGTVHPLLGGTGCEMAVGSAVALASGADVSCQNQTSPLVGH